MANAHVALITDLEPRSSHNLGSIGFDMYSDGVRRQAIDASARLGEPVATGKVQLAQDARQPDEPAFLLYMPVFQTGNGKRTLIGFVYNPLRGREFLNSAASSLGKRDVQVSLFDSTADPANLLAKRQLEGPGSRAIDRKIRFGQRDWVLRVSHKQPQSLSQLSLISLVLGLVLALLVTVIAWTVTRTAEEDSQLFEWLQQQASIRDTLIRELNHRVKNTLANVLSIIALTHQRSVGLDEFTDSITGRIRALSATHDLLSQNDWSDALVADVIGSELAPYYQPGEDGSAVEMNGPDLTLAPNDALSLGMAIHELATNAAKYGALSMLGGKVKLEWHPVTDKILEVNWRETGGPPVKMPTKNGFGRDLIEKIVAHQLQSKVDLRFEPDGVICTLRVPLRKPSEFSLRSRQPATASGEPSGQ